jgi:PAB-dependent poly(A)-specific ribonuclease subunit 2
VRTFDSNRFVAISDLPPILAVNANVSKEESLEYWLDTRKQRFLTQSVELHVQPLDESEELSSVTYNLRVSASFSWWAIMLMNFKAIIIQVVGKEGHSHLVALIKGSCFNMLRCATA